jgi:hypothetical protein
MFIRVPGVGRVVHPGVPTNLVAPSASYSLALVRAPFPVQSRSTDVAPVFLPLIRAWRDGMADYAERDLRVITDFLTRIEGRCRDQPAPGPPTRQIHKG